MNRFTISTMTLGLATLSACVTTELEPNPDHCTRNEGDTYCAELFAELPLCNSGKDECAIGDRYGCVATVAPECHAPCGEQDDFSCVDDEGSGTSTGGSDSGSDTEEESSSGEGSTTTGPTPCRGNEECNDGAAPICDLVIGECVTCDQVTDGDAACAQVDAMTPLCVEAQCVACTGDDPSVCDEQLLVCDQGTNACAPCAEHAQCDSGACDVVVGECFDPANVLQVGMGQPYTSVGAALAAVGTMRLTSAVLRLHAGMDFNEAAAVSEGAVAFIAAEGQSPQWINSASMSPTLMVSGADTRVYIEGIRLSGNLNDVGLVVDAATVDIRRSRIVQNSGGGIVAQGGATLNVQNCFVGGSVNVTGIEVNGSSAEILYSTVTASTFGSTPALGCTSATAVDVRNSIVMTQGGTSPDELACEGAVVTNSATEAETPPFDSGWFVNYDVGDFHLSPTAPPGLSNAAQWQDGDPLTDIDGDPRPATDGSPDYAGADVPL